MNGKRNLAGMTGRCMEVVSLLIFWTGLVFSVELDPIPPGLLDPIQVPERPPQRLQPQRPGVPRPSSNRRQRAEEQQRVQDVERHLAQAQAHDQAGRWRMALSEYQHLMRLEPNEPAHVLRAALLSTMIDQYASADSYFLRLQEMIGTVPPQPAAVWANALLHLGELDRAGSVLESSLLKQPDLLISRFYQLILDVAQEQEPDTDYWLVRSMAEQVRLAGWILTEQDDLRRWVGVDGIRTMMRNSLGEIRLSDLQATYDHLRDAMIELQRQDWNVALNHLAAAHALGVNRPYLLLEMARSRMSMGKNAEAAALVLEVLAAHASPEELAYPAAYILIGAERYAEAVDILQAALDPDRDEGMRMQMALAYAWSGSGDLDSAWPILQEMSRRFTADFPEWMSGNTPHIRAIRADPRFAEFGIR